MVLTTPNGGRGRPQATVPAALAAFEAELAAGLARWPVQAVQGTSARLQGASLQNAVAGDRAVTLELLGWLKGRAGALEAALVHELSVPADTDEARPAATPSSGAPLLKLSLVDESQIDEDIAVANIVKLIELQCEAELAQLTGLCSGLTGREEISTDANPLQPIRVARALRRAVVAADPPGAVRLRLLREMGHTLGAALRAEYARLSDLLELWGIEPARYKVRAAITPPRVGPAAAPARPGPVAAGDGPLARLVRSARASAVPRSAPVADAPIRLLSEAVEIGEAAPLNADDAVRVMDRLLALLAAQPGMPAPVRQLLQRLDQPARKLAAHDAELWRSLEHPWWQLMDRVISAGSVEPADSASGVVTETLELVVQRLEGVAATEAHHVRQALHEMDFAVSGLVVQRGAEIAPQAGAMQVALDLESLRLQLRDQLIQQLRSTPAPALLHQFLLGPWLAAMVGAASAGPDGQAPLRACAGLVDEFIAACSATGHGPLPSAQRADLIARASAVLRAGATDAGSVETHLAGLAEVLEHPGPPVTDIPEPPVDTLPVPLALGLHDGLPTVPIDTFEVSGLTPAVADRQAWLDSLEPGDYCRLFLLERWMNVQLSWRSENRGMFVFSSRHAGGANSLTRRALEKLRAAGLAATIEHGQLIGQVMDTLTEDLMR